MERKTSKKKTVKKSSVKSKPKEGSQKEDKNKSGKHLEDKHKEDKDIEDKPKEETPADDKAKEEGNAEVEMKACAKTPAIDVSDQKRQAKKGDGTLQAQGKSITQAERDEIRAAYNLLSNDSNGKMGMREIHKLLQSQFMAFTDNQAIELFHKLDPDRTGDIDFEEFEKYVIENNLVKPTQEEYGADMKDAFAMFDTDNNGYIDTEEFKACMMMLGDKMGDEEIAELMKEADTNGDGQIDYAEFCAHVSKALFTS